MAAREYEIYLLVLIKFVSARGHDGLTYKTCGYFVTCVVKNKSNEQDVRRLY